jgi:hypothetical protein
MRRARRYWLIPALVAGVMAVPSAPAGATTTALNSRIIVDGCPGTVIGPSRGTAEMGFYSVPGGLGTFRTYVTLDALKNLPLHTYFVRLVWRDAALPQNCVFLSLGAFSTSLLGSGAFGSITDDIAFTNAFPASATGLYDIWAEAAPDSSFSTGTLVAGPITCNSAGPVQENPSDCPAF